MARCHRFPDMGVFLHVFSPSQRHVLGQNMCLAHLQANDKRALRIFRQNTLIVQKHTRVFPTTTYNIDTFDAHTIIVFFEDSAFREANVAIAISREHLPFVHHV
ncbi:hypothetical protein BT63DRAFT_129714 [Microthyrium microscopicum]|uniref:Uncharacterized protein n=1 Tax=Microthyrium microscopicum TaxID=703497 RepID=A0A6A6TTS3_9PEZI|nr:hypothetical protein BT63DRAFT_129714 [Microthyrium microscopicum]